MKAAEILTYITVIIITNSSVFGQSAQNDTLYNFNAGQLSNSFASLLDWVMDAAFYYEVDTNNNYDINEVQLQFISSFESWWAPLPHTFRLTFRIGNLDTIPYNGMVLWPTQNTGDPVVDIWSALPGEEIATLEVTINDSTELYPNWKTVELDTIAALKNLNGNFWLTANTVLFRTLWDSVPPSSSYTFANNDNGFWSTERDLKFTIQWN